MIHRLPLLVSKNNCGQIGTHEPLIGKIGGGLRAQLSLSGAGPRPAAASQAARNSLNLNNFRENTFVRTIVPCPAEHFPQGYEVGGEGGESNNTFTAENTSTAPRAAQIRLGSGFVLTLKQSGYPTISCQYSPSSATIHVGSSGANVNNVYATVVIP